MSVYQEITDRFLTEIKKGVIPWRKPWTVGSSIWAVSHATGKPYSFLNSLLCGAGEFVTFAGAKREGGHVNKGARGTSIFVPLIITSKKDKDADEESNEESKSFVGFRKMVVFNIDNTTGLTPKVEPEPTFKNDPIEAADKVCADYIARSGLTLVVDKKSSRAFYRPTEDTVVCPMREQFEDVAEFYATLFHELGHSTGAEKRLNRDLGNSFGDSDYSREELVAEFTTTIILTTLGIDTPSTWQNSAAYIHGWAKAFNDDAKMITWAAGKADKAAALILGTKEKEAA